MQFKLSSCFATHSESVAVVLVLVLVVECPNLHRPPAIIPPLHPSSVVSLAALILFTLSLIPSPYYSSQSHYNIYSAAKVFNLSLQVSKNVL